MNMIRNRPFWKFWGPLIIWSLAVVIGWLIKGIAFTEKGAWIDIAPSGIMWATGIILTICTSDIIFSRSLINRIYTRSNRALAFNVQYEITLPNDHDFDNDKKYVYILFISILAWVIDLFISGLAKAILISEPSLLSLEFLKLFALIFISFFIFSSAITLAFSLLKEVSYAN